MARTALRTGIVLVVIVALAVAYRAYETRHATPARHASVTTTTRPPAFVPASSTSPTTTFPAPTALLSLANPTTYSPNSQPIGVDYSSTNAVSCYLSVSPALWTGPDPMVTPCNGSYETSVANNTVQEEWRFTFTATNPEGLSARSRFNFIIQAPTPTTAAPSCTFQSYSGSFICS